MGELERLFSAAEKSGGLEYIFTLVRVEGITCGKRDALIELRSFLGTITGRIPDEKVVNTYKKLIVNRESFTLLANLTNCATKQPYRFMPFLHLRKGTFPNFQEPTTDQIIQTMLPLLNNAGFGDIASRIQEVYRSDLLSIPEKIAEIKGVLSGLQNFLLELVNVYFKERLKFKRHPRFYKLPRFEVLELLTNDEYGLYGFNVYFSNGSSATFTREIDKTQCINVTPGDTVGFQVGMWDEMTNRWKVKDKCLYEIGLPGRYNNHGEWKPIVYPKGSEEIDEEIRKITDDYLVQGCLFYIMTTCHRVIEFVVRTNINIPHEQFSFGDKFHLFKCPNIEGSAPLAENYIIYDGWYELESIDPEYIRRAIATIGVGVNRMAFAYNGKVEWRLKYHNKPVGAACAVPSKEDLNILDAMFRKFPVSEDAIFLDAAIEWFNRGRSSHSTYVSFLCYYLSFELLAIAIAEGDANFGFVKEKRDKKSIETEKIKCVDEKLKALYDKDPIEFVEKAYFDCVKSLRNKTQEVAEWVFGKDHEYVKSLFEKREGYSLSDLRARIAHGTSGLVNQDIEQVIETRAYELGAIVKSFLTRITFGLKPEDSLPIWSGQHMASMQTSDPRGTHVVSDLKIIPNTDWRIRQGWVDEF